MPHARRQRLRHLRAAALRALDRYPLLEPRLTFIAHSENATYRVDTPEGRYLLRLHVPHHPGAICAGGQTAPAIASELVWLQALRAAGLPVPEPLATRSGEVVRVVNVEGEPQPVPSTLMCWVAGRFPTTLTLDHCRKAGELMASLHDHASGWEPPPAFQRPAWDWASFESALAEMDALVARAPADLALSRADVEVFRACAERIRCTTEPPARGLWGLIHADLHTGNLIFHRGEARAIDFSRCGHGHFVYDIAECCRFIGSEKRRAFAEGYRRRRALPEDYPELLEAFFVRGWIENFGFHAPNPAEQEWLREAVPPFVEHLTGKYLKGEVMLTR
jgi:Ser/Thr protein kinase RdoA (MazF antagonist)